MVAQADDSDRQLFGIVASGQSHLPLHNSPFSLWSLGHFIQAQGHHGGIVGRYHAAK